MAAFVGNRQFPGIKCHNKKDGRKEAADLALRTLIAEGQYSAASQSPVRKHSFFVVVFVEEMG